MQTFAVATYVNVTNPALFRLNSWGSAASAK